MKIKVINKSNNPLPKYESSQAAGLDIRADIDHPIIIHPMKRCLIPTNLYTAIPSGYEVQIRPRSGLALKKGITVLNTPGTIDADYRGNWGVILMNLGDEDFIVNPGDRIAQAILNKVEQIEWEEVESLDETERGQGGFNSTGIN